MINQFDGAKIINFCPTGTQSTKENSNAPISINEIIDEVQVCNEKGITLVHIHARDEAGQNTSRKDVFQKIIEGVKCRIPDLTICVSLSGRYIQEQSLRTEVLSLYPDLASLTMSSLNFPTGASINTPDTILWIIDEMEKYGVNPEIECFDIGMLNYTNYLLEKNILKLPIYINVIFGNLFSANIDPVAVSAMMKYLPLNSTTCFGGIGKAQLKANIYGLLEADGVRVGLEDNFYLRGKQKATNLELIERVYRLMAELGQSCMTSTDFKKLGYANRKANNIR